MASEKAVLFTVPPTVVTSAPEADGNLANVSARSARLPDRSAIVPTIVCPFVLRGPTSGYCGASRYFRNSLSVPMMSIVPGSITFS